MNFDLNSGLRVTLIGDPHMGRRFETGVPSHRRGEREAAQFAKLEKALIEPCEISICVGDLFDHPYVPYKTVLEVSALYLAAAACDSSKRFVVLAGNHDKPRNLEGVGAWEAFRKIVSRSPNILVVDKPRIFEGVALFPWEWGVSAATQAMELEGNYDFAVGHWDLQSYGGDDSHLCPVPAFYSHVKLFSGHYHLPGIYEIDGREIVCTGSLEPYSHAEDPSGELYVTLPLEDVLASPEALKNKVVRVLLRDGEELPTGLDCLGLTGKRMTEEMVEDGPTEIGAFDWKKILDECLADVPAYVREFIDDRLRT